MASPALRKECLMIGATVLYKTGKLHLISSRWSEDSVFCLEAGSHSMLDLKEIGPIEEFARSICTDQASMRDLRDLITREDDLHLPHKVSDDQVLRRTALLLGQRRLKAVVCRRVTVNDMRPAAPAAVYAAPFHLQRELAAAIDCPYALNHRVRQWNDPAVVGSFVRRLLENEEVLPQLRQLALIGGEKNPATDDDLAKRLERLLMSGRVIAIECPLAERPGSRRELEQKASAARAAATQRKDADRRPVKTWVEIRLVDDEGSPVPNELYRIVLPDGSTVEGTLDWAGCARYEEIDAGSCKVCFPEIDARAWRPA